MKKLINLLKKRYNIYSYKKLCQNFSTDLFVRIQIAQLQ